MIPTKKEEKNKSFKEDIFLCNNWQKEETAHKTANSPVHIRQQTATIAIFEKANRPEKNPKKYISKYEKLNSEQFNNISPKDRRENKISLKFQKKNPEQFEICRFKKPLIGEDFPQNNSNYINRRYSTSNLNSESFNLEDRTCLDNNRGPKFLETEYQEIAKSQM